MPSTHRQTHKQERGQACRNADRFKDSTHADRHAGRQAATKVSSPAEIQACRLKPDLSTNSAAANAENWVIALNNF